MGGTSRVPAENILHLYNHFLQPGQQRGQPWLTPVLATLDLEHYDTAELIRKKLAAMVVAFEISQDPSMDATAIIGRDRATECRRKGWSRARTSLPAARKSNGATRQMSAEWRSLHERPTPQDCRRSWVSTSQTGDLNGV